MSRRGRLLRTEPPTADALLTPSELRRLARLARRARQVFGGPQDIDFGFGFDEEGDQVGGGRLWLFQSRPITAMAARPSRGARLLGPGPLAETLPEQLQPLEEDLRAARRRPRCSSKSTRGARGADMTAERQALAAQQVWERCRDSTSVPLDHATLGSLGDGMFAGVVRPALAEHDRMRLRGCLEDAALDRAHLTVMGMGDTDPDDD